MCCRTRVEDHTGVEDPAWVERVLDLAHQRDRLLPPLLVEERGHVATGAVLGLERAVVAIDDEFGQVAQETVVASDLVVAAEVLGEHEVDVPFEGMAEDHRVGVPVGDEQFLQIERGGGKLRHRERDVLDDHGGADRTHRAHRGEQALADVPEPGVHGCVVGELVRSVDGDVVDRTAHRGDVRRQLSGGRRPRLDQQCGHRVGKLAQVVGHPRFVLDRSQAGAIHQFHGCHRLRGEGSDRVASVGDRREHHERRGLVGRLEHGVEHHVAHEREGSLGADHQVGDHVDRIVEVDERVEAVPHRVLREVRPADPIGQCRVGLGGCGEFVDAIDEVGAIGPERRHRRRVARVEPGAVGEHQRQRRHRLVCVLLRAAAHAAGVVGDDATDHGSVDRRRIGADLALERGQRRVGPAPDDAGLEPDAVATVEHLEPGPEARGEYEHGVADRLAGQAGASCPEGDGNAECARFAQDQCDFGERLGLDHDLGDQSVEAGVGAVGEGAGGVGDASGGVDRRGTPCAGQPIEQRGVRSLERWFVGDGWASHQLNTSVYPKT